MWKPWLPANLFLYDRQTLGPCVHRWSILKLGPGPAEHLWWDKSTFFPAEVFKLFPRSPAPIQVSHQTLVLLGIPKIPFSSWSYCTFSYSYLCVLGRQHRVKGQMQLVGQMQRWMTLEPGVRKLIQVDSSSSDVLNRIISKLREA